MPGTVIAVDVADLDLVAEGQPLLSIEAMKMEHQLTAPVAGVVRLSLKVGDLVKAAQIVATVKPLPNQTGDADTGPAEAAAAQQLQDVKG
jgi:acetyl-CoA/propionyl-CoA carboxylase biotin carboxyl carrier protein